jgi:hypothetical protein
MIAFPGRDMVPREPWSGHRRNMFPTGLSALRPATAKSTGARTRLPRTGDGFPVMRTERGTGLTETLGFRRMPPVASSIRDRSGDGPPSALECRALPA